MQSIFTGTGTDGSSRCLKKCQTKDPSPCLKDGVKLTTQELYNTSYYFQVGQIAGTHALKGEVKIFPMTDDPERFTSGLVLFMEDARGAVRELTVERSRQNGKFVLVKFKGLDSIDDVERFRGNKLFIDRADAIPLEEGEYYVADLIGLAVYDEVGALLGELTDVIETGANDVYAVRLAETYGRAEKAERADGTGSANHAGSVEDITGAEGIVRADGACGGKRKKTAPEVLLPAIPECILDIDLANRRMTVHVMDGLM